MLDLKRRSTIALLQLGGFIALAVLPTPPADGQQPPPAADTTGWVGKRIILQFGSVLKVGNQVVDNQKLKASVSGGLKQTSRIYRVERVDGPWLWLKAEGEGTAGWIRAAEVVLYDQAIDYFTNQIRSNPASEQAYTARAHIWKDKGEFDIALADYNEAVRLDANSEVTWNNRGNAWASKAEYDKAISDYDQAIRIDPKYSTAYYNRGIAWRNKKDLDRAIADYTLAISNDPTYSKTYRVTD